MGEPIDMPFGADSCWSKEPCIRWGQDQTNLFIAARGDTGELCKNGLTYRDAVGGGGLSRVDSRDHVLVEGQD